MILTKSCSILTSLIFFGSTFAYLQSDDYDDKDSRIQAGNSYLSSSRIDKWAGCFEKGLPAFGKIVAKLDSRLLSECWIEDKHFWIKKISKTGQVSISFGNPHYSAELTENKGGYHIRFVGEPADILHIIPIEAIPIAQQSSVCYTRAVIPHYLRDGKLVVTDYRLKDRRHFLELSFTDETNKQNIELVFDERDNSFLPSETIFNLDSKSKTHTVQSGFTDVEGFVIPKKMDVVLPRREKGAEMLAFPDQRLDKKTCFLKYYGLPEPDGWKSTNFGRGSKEISLYYFMVAVGIVALAVVSVALLMRKRRER